MDAFRRLVVDKRNSNATQEPQGDKALLPISEPVVLESEGGPLKYSWRIAKVKAVGLEVNPTLPFVPGETHRQSVYTSLQSVKVSLFALTFELRGARADV